MAEPHATIDRRTLLRLLGATGAAVTAASSEALFARRAAAAAPSARGGAAAQEEDPDRIEPYRVSVSDAELEDLQRRLENVRWPPDSPGEPWSYGTDRGYLEELVEYWRDRYDWRAHEAALNTFNHYTTTIEGQRIHFIQERGRGPAPLPLLMTHGWPGTVWEMLPSVRQLANPALFGGEAGDAFSVVVPSIPGFGFSGEPREGTDVARTAELWVQLMDRLGYERFGAYGSDWGALITRILGARYPDRLVGVHTPGSPPRAQRDPRTDAERAFLESAARWSVDETGYQRIQGTKPQTLAFGLTDSPAGVAAWVTEKLRSWSDCDGDVENRFSKDQILTLVSIYWHTRTIGTSVRYYHANGLGSPGPRPAPEPVRVPQGFAAFPGMPNRVRMPRSYVDELPDNVTHWTEYDSGGHFPAIEEPDLLVDDLRDFFRPLRSG